MRIEVPKCYLNPPDKMDKYEKNSYSRVESKGSLFAREVAGYRIERSQSLEVKTILLDIFNKTFELDARFEDLLDEINDSKYILDLKEGWGDNGASIPFTVYQSAIEFVLNYSEYILSNYQITISTPEIKPVRDGSIDLVWNTKLAYMAINIRFALNSLLGTFFSFKHENKKIKEGELDLVTVEPAIANWMTSLK